MRAVSDFGTIAGISSDKYALPSIALTATAGMGASRVAVLASLNNPENVNEDARENVPEMEQGVTSPIGRKVTEILSESLKPISMFPVPPALIVMSAIGNSRVGNDHP